MPGTEGSEFSLLLSPTPVTPFTTLQYSKKALSRCSLSILALPISKKPSVAYKSISLYYSIFGA